MLQINNTEIQYYSRINPIKLINPYKQSLNGQN